jgi:hypothetical protein
MKKETSDEVKIRAEKRVTRNVVLLARDHPVIEGLGPLLAVL